MKNRMAGKISRLFACLSLLLAINSPAIAIRAEHHAPDAQSDDTESKQIEVQSTSASEPALLDPDNRVWKNVPASNVQLFWQNVAKPFGGGSVRAVSVSALQSKTGLAVRMQWPDATENNASSSGTLKDAAAIQFPIVGDAYLAMGHPEKPVTIWHWMAARQHDGTPSPGEPRVQLNDKPSKPRDFSSCVEELVAAGHENKAPQPDHLKTLFGHAVWSKGHWTLVVFKSNNGGKDSSPVFDRNHKLPIAFAIWDGGAGEVLGMKSISNWEHLHFEQK